ncbi:tRNA pseudouridine(13) synthase TruD [Suttonella sp. R2A3]|uniref:tRNA pseudouridine(13) synthase TruD n=1 Tax=Suttonella sp. R2A3 TaxID=2908648 RepID=UPI001F25D83D|nr:tRNA pseudouridine(13) synthase TruD [Suttonella sp. R2A3]UJF24485.1 tRNA pseudouridine(13) synthase TruD [Suttonella sp. R2A3]
MNRATIKQTPEDFYVAEVLDFPLTGEGEHLWCYVEKTGMNTAFLKREWARLLECPGKLISHSGLKDRHARTRQWLCLPAKDAEGLPDQGEQWRIVERKLHQKKLRIGTHRSNDFTLVLRDVVGDRDAMEEKLARTAELGFANAFGAQRFGHNNIERAMKWVAREQLPKKRDERAQTLSTLRALLFNAELQTRLTQNTAHSLLVGDYAMLCGSNSFFMVEEVDEALRTRLAEGDIVPAGVLPGKSKAQYEGAAQQVRALAYTDYEAAVSYLQRFSDQDCRALTVRAQNLSWQWLDEHTLQLSFNLPRGSFATALLEDVFDQVIDASSP